MLGYIISKNDNINVIEHEIQSFDVLHKTDLNIFIVENGEVLYKNNITYEASYHGHVQVLEWYKRSGYVFKYNKRAIDCAMIFGHVHVLEWFKHSGYEFICDKKALNCASINGHVQVLEWFKHSGYDFKYDRWAIKNAKNIIILKFFIKNINPKKVIKWSKRKEIKILRFKAKKRYFKGYKKN